MVKRFLKQLLHREFSGLHEAAFLLGIFALASQVIALLRDRYFAHLFGAGEVLDVYYAAFRVPDIIFVSIASFVAITVIMPFLIEEEGRSKAAARRFLNTIFTVFFVAIVTLSAVMYWLMPGIIDVVYPGFSEVARADTTTLARILLLSPIFLGISNVYASVTQSNRQFFVYAISPVLYNVGIIFGAVFLYPSFGMSGLAWGVIVGAVLHMVVQLPVVSRAGLLPRFTLNIDWVYVWRVIRLALPRTIGLSVHQGGLLVLTSLAASVAVGAVASFQLSFNLQSVPLSIIGVSYSVAAFPMLARLFTEQRTKEFTEQVLTAMRHILFWSLPVIALFVVLRAQIVRTILGTGAFSWPDTKLVAASLALFAVSVAAQSLILLYVRGYYAAGNTRTPVVVNVLWTIGSIALAYVLLQLFHTTPLMRYFFEAMLRVEDIPGTAILMLPLAFSLGMIGNAIMLWLLFKRDFLCTKYSRVYRAFGQSFSASVILGAVSYLVLQLMAPIVNQQTLPGIFLQGLVAGVMGLIAGVLVLYLMGNREIREAGEALRHKFWRTKVVIPDKEEL